MKETEGGISRRRFLATALATVTAPLLPGDTPVDQSWVAPRTNSRSTPLLKIADTHIGDSDLANFPTLAIADAAYNLKRVLDKLNGISFYKKFHLGDTNHNGGNERENLESLTEFLEIFDNEAIIVLGNHDLIGIKPDNRREAYQNHNFHAESSGTLDLPNIQLVWIEPVCKVNELSYLSESTVDWLKQTINPDKKTIILSHIPFFPTDTRGHAYFEADRQKSYLQNGIEVWNEIRDMRVFALMHGHMHWDSYSQITGTHIITLPAFSEKIGGASDNPGIYTIVEVTDTTFLLRSFYQDRCVFQIALPI